MECTFHVQFKTLFNYFFVRKEGIFFYVFISFFIFLNRYYYLKYIIRYVNECFFFRSFNSLIYIIRPKFTYKRYKLFKF